MSNLSAWPALVLTAGKATRLRPLSLVRAKAAMPVAGTPIIIRILRWLRAAGVRDVVMNLHHRPETITAVVGDGSAANVRVRYSWEPTILGSAGGPRRALPLLDAERFLIVNGDTLTNCSLPDLVHRHETSRALVTLALVNGDVERYGGAVVDRDGFVTGFARAHAVAAHAAVRHFIGVQAVEAAAFAALPEDEPSETVRTVYPQLIASQPRSVAAYESDAEFLDVGTARDYLDTVRLIAAREHKAFDRGDAVDVPADAAVTDSILWDRVRIGRGARLTRCIVADDVTVPDGASHADAVIVRGDSGLHVEAL
jgi:mannose-1-phosphate guanylyltransferase